VPHGGFTDPEYASVGMSEEKAQASGQEYLAVVVPYANMDRAVIDGRPEGFCKLIVSQENHRILGASVAGEGAVEIVHVVAAGMAADIWVEQLAELELAYPTFSAIIGLAAREAVYQLGVTPLATQWRALGRRRAAEWERDNNP
jgi:pyruvate/2-oxoglutarate dehydrogenase complex dihydrolipoamide dehydrogenase (E3) component